MSTGFIVRLLAPLLWLLLALPHVQAHSQPPAHTPIQPTPLPEPTGRVILTLSGDIGNPNVGDEAQFDRAMLEALPSRVIETHTPWHSDKGRFEGPLVRALLEVVGADGDCLRIRALNDFEARVPRSDFYDHDVILAMSRNGQPLGIRDYGPLFVVYPFDAHPELLTEAVRFRSVWHVERIIVP
ncbi:MAG: oxidoreductase [Halomonas sp.]|nr:oxidoreductase [Halomonas sp.]